MRTMVVFKAKRANEEAWAWCLVNESGVGFEEIHYTDTMGFGPVEPSEELRLIEVVFTVTIPATSAAV